jgi:PPOX class probable F420-dependent enzyme
MPALSERAQSLIHRRVYAHVATVGRNGAPHVVPVWVDTDGEHVIINAPENTVKVTHMRREPRVAVSILDPDDPGGTLQVTGRVVDITTEGADEHIDRMQQKYTGAERYERRSGSARVIVKILPDKMTGGAARDRR